MEYTKIEYMTASASALEDAFNEFVGLSRYLPIWEQHGNLYWMSTLPVTWGIEQGSSKEVFVPEGAEGWYDELFKEYLLEYSFSNGDNNEQYMTLEDVLCYMVRKGKIPAGSWLIYNE